MTMTALNRITPNTVPGWASTILHAIVLGGVSYGLATKQIDPTTAAAILAGMGGFWSGVGAVHITTGTPSAATEPGSPSVGLGTAPTPSSDPLGAQSDHPGQTAPPI